MDLHISVEDNRYMEKFFRKFPQYEQEVKDNLYYKLPDIILNRPHKIKSAYHLKRDKLTIYEYKVVVKNANFRAAYTQTGNEVNVFFISETIIRLHANEVQCLDTLSTHQRLILNHYPIDR